MSETETTTEPAPAPETKRGRGPTRPEVRFADLVGEAQRIDPAARDAFLTALSGGELPAAIRAAAKTTEAELKAHLKTQEACIAAMRARAELIEEANRLPNYLRAALGAAICAKEE